MTMADQRTAADQTAYDGSCLCGAVRYRIRGPLGPLDNCHCTDCRKSHGAAFATYLEVPVRSLDWLAGRETLRTYAAASGTKRSFCPTCGSTLICWVDSEPDLVEVAAGTLDTPLRARIVSHTFVRSKAPWYEIHDGAPQYATTKAEG